MDRLTETSTAKSHHTAPVRDLMPGTERETTASKGELSGT